MKNKHFVNPIFRKTFVLKTRIGVYPLIFLINILRFLKNGNYIHQ